MTLWFGTNTSGSGRIVWAEQTIEDAPAPDDDLPEPDNDTVPEPTETDPEAEAQGGTEP